MIFHALKNQWQLLRQDEPGQRFVKLHERRSQAGGRGIGRVALWIAAVLLMLIGLALMVLPGPGIPVFAVGIAVLAGESRWMARTTDIFELKLRALVKQVSGRDLPR